MKALFLLLSFIDSAPPEPPAPSFESKPYSIEHKGAQQYGWTDPLDELLGEEDSLTLLEKLKKALGLEVAQTGKAAVWERLAETLGTIAGNRGPSQKVLAKIIAIESVSPVTSSAMKQIQSWSNQLVSMNSEPKDQSLLSKLQRDAAWRCEQPLLQQGFPLLEARHRCKAHKEKTQPYDFAKTLGELGSFEDISLWTQLLGNIAIDAKQVTITPPAALSAVKAFYGTQKEEIEALLLQLQQKLIEDQPIEDPALLAFIEESPLPLPYLLSLLTCDKGQEGSRLAILRWAGLLAHHRALHILQEGIETWLQLAKQLQSDPATYPELLETYTLQIKEVQESLLLLKRDWEQRIELEQKAFETLKPLEESLRKKTL